MESMITSMLRGKNITEEGNTSVQTPIQNSGSKTSMTRVAERILTVEESTSIAKKVEKPNFDGTDPIEWIARTEQSFKIQNIPEELKISLALISMEGAPLHWLRWMRQRNP